ncbi:hypothetical protein RUM44_003068 [Polyplax serrata]|uniref:Secreted protein n=1 Tax=Polyplax serrata TaxID=468196 RepID=A0ABR1AXG0_POLSC
MSNRSDLSGMWGAAIFSWLNCTIQGPRVEHRAQVFELGTSQRLRTPRIHPEPSEGTTQWIAYVWLLVDVSVEQDVATENTDERSSNEIALFPPDHKLLRAV